MSMTTPEAPVQVTYDTVRMIWETEFSNLVSAVYGRPYQLQQQDAMMGQDQIERVRVPDEEWDADWCLESFHAWRDADATPPEGDRERWKWELDWERLNNDEDCMRYSPGPFFAVDIPTPPAGTIMNDLHARGLIEGGDYVIHAWW